MVDLESSNATAKCNEDCSPGTLILPEHIIYAHILSRLPVKSLIRFKSVSKSWYSAISSPEFANSHLKISSSSSHQFLLVIGHTYKLLLLPYDELNNLKNPVEVDFSLNSIVEQWGELQLEIVGSCNGLICLYNYVKFDRGGSDCGFFSICNPATHQYCEIPKPYPGNFSALGYWFGCTSSIDDYKIVAQCLSRNKDEDNDDDDDECLHFYVYSLRTRKWKIIYELDKVDFKYEMSSITTVFNDVLYWSHPRLNHSQKPRCIIGFDLVNERLKELPWMEWLSRYLDATFFVMNGCLAILCGSNDRPVSDVWILKQHENWSTWEKLFSLHLGRIDLFSVNPAGKFLGSEYCSILQSRKFMMIDTSKDTQEQFQGGTYLCSESILGGAGGYCESLISPFGTIKPPTEEED